MKATLTSFIILISSFSFSSWSELISFGEDVPDGLQLVERLQDLAINRCCTLVYTSGTTGNPKGVMLSHDNVSWTALNALSVVEAVPNAEVVVSYLPLNHVAAQLFELWLPLFAQGLVYFADKSALKGTLVETLKVARPTRFLAVPR